MLCIGFGGEEKIANLYGLSYNRMSIGWIERIVKDGKVLERT